MGYDVTKLALDTLKVGPAKEPEDDHQERHNYYRELRDKQRSGGKLSADEASWMESATKAYEEYQASKSAPAQSAHVPPKKPGSVPYGATQIRQGKGPSELEDFNPTVQSFLKAMSVAPPAVRQGAFSHLLSNGAPSVAPMAQQEKFEARHQDFLQPQGKPNYTFYPKDEPVVAMDEAGREVKVPGDRSGPTNQKQFLKNEQDFGRVRTLERKPNDVSLADKDQFGSEQLEKMYGPHLKEVDDNGGKYPAGYFDGMSPERKQNIKAGVVELMRRRRGIRT